MLNKITATKTKTKVSTGLGIALITLAAVAAATAVGFAYLSAGLPAATLKSNLVNSSARAAKKCEAFPDPQAMDKNQASPNFKVADSKIYQGCEIDYLQFKAKTAKNDALRAKLSSLPKERQQELNYQLKQTQEAVKAKGGTWKADWNLKMALSDEEKKNLNGLRGEPPVLPKTSTKVLGISTITLPDFFDWRDVGGQNYITSVKDQGNVCGSCWAFGADAAFEGHIQAFYNNPGLVPDLAEQDLVSCGLPYPSGGVGGCNGAYDYQIESIFSTYWKNTGNVLETCFPYTGSNAACNKCAGWQAGAWKDLSYKRIYLTSNIVNNINNIKQAVVENGPVEVGMAVYADFLSYSSGIYRHVGELLLGYHAVTIVGFGRSDGLDYWIVKNSWGSSWGENGYFKIFADDSYISSWFAIALNGPNPPTAQNVVCTDNDADGYCYWGLGAKPAAGCAATCASQALADCDDSDGAIYQGCGVSAEQLGTINLTSQPSEAEIYTKDLTLGEYIYRGNTPLTFNLDAGTREIKLLKPDYEDNYFSQEILPGQAALPINVVLQKLPKIDSPLSGDFFSNKGQITISGTTPLRTDLAFQNYVVEYGAGKSPAQWLSDGLSYSGSQPVESGILAAWDTQAITSGSYYTIRLTVNYAGRSVQTNTAIYIDPSIKQGWPAHVNFNTDFSESLGDTPPVVSDLDKDGNKEIIIYGGGDPPRLFVYGPSGNLIWQKDVGAGNHFGGFQPRPVVGDFNNDGYDEIIVSSYSKSLPYAEIYVFDRQGNLLAGWNPRYIFGEKGGDWYSTMSLADVNNDGGKELIVKGNWGKVISNNEKIVVLNFSGSVISNITLPYPGLNYFFDYSIPVVGNLDADTDLEIISYGPADNRESGFLAVHAFNLDGSEVAGWPIKVQGSPMRTSPVIGDLDNDGNEEVIFIADFNKLYAYKHDGSLFWSWSATSIFGDLSLADPNKDGKLEVIYSFYNRFSSTVRPFVNILMNDGAQYPGWPQSTMYYNVRYPIIGDLNGDKASDIFGLISSVGQGSLYPPPDRDMYAYMYGWNQTGVALQNISRFSERYLDAPPVIADIDNDGKTEIVLVAARNEYLDDNKKKKNRNDIFVYELGAAYTPSEWPMTLHDPQNTGRYIRGLDLLIKDVALIGTEAAPALKFNLCMNGPLSLADIGKGAFTFESVTYNSSNQESQKQTASIGGSAIQNMKNGACVLYKNYPLGANQIAEFKANGKITLKIDPGNKIAETDKTNNEFTSTPVDLLIKDVSLVGSETDPSLSFNICNDSSNSLSDIGLQYFAFETVTYNQADQESQKFQMPNYKFANELKNGACYLQRRLPLTTYQTVEFVANRKITLKIDPQRSIFETDKTNNVFTLTVIPTVVPTVFGVVIDGCSYGVGCTWQAGTTRAITWWFVNFSSAGADPATAVNTVALYLCNPVTKACIIGVNAGVQLNKVWSGYNKSISSFNFGIGANILTDPASQPYINNGQVQIKICPTYGSGQIVPDGVCTSGPVFTIFSPPVDLLIKNVALIGTEAAPALSFNICMNGPFSLADIGLGAFTFQMFTYDSSGQESQKFETSWGGSAVSNIKNGDCVFIKNLPLTAGQIPEFNANPKIAIKLDPGNSISETDKTNNEAALDATPTAVPTVNHVSITNCPSPCSWQAGTSHELMWTFSDFSPFGADPATAVNTVVLNFCNPVTQACTVGVNAGVQLNKVWSGYDIGRSFFTLGIGANILTNPASQPYINNGQQMIKVCPTYSSGQDVPGGVCALSPIYTIVAP